MNYLTFGLLVISVGERWVVMTTYRGTWNPPTQNFNVNTDDTTHTLKGYKTVYCLYNWGLWGRSEQASQADPKCFEGARKRSRFLLWLRGGLSFYRWAGTWVIWVSSPCQRREYSSFLMVLPKCGAQREEGEVKLKGCQHTPKNGVRFLITWVLKLSSTIVQF